MPPDRWVCLWEKSLKRKEISWSHRFKKSDKSCTIQPPSQHQTDFHEKFKRWSTSLCRLVSNYNKWASGKLTILSWTALICRKTLLRYLLVTFTPGPGSLKINTVNGESRDLVLFLNFNKQTRFACWHVNTFLFLNVWLLLKEKGMPGTGSCRLTGLRPSQKSGERGLK